MKTLKKKEDKIKSKVGPLAIRNARRGSTYGSHVTEKDDFGHFLPPESLHNYRFTHLCCETTKNA